MDSESLNSFGKQSERQEQRSFEELKLLSGSPQPLSCVIGGPDSLFGSPRLEHGKPIEGFQAFSDAFRVGFVMDDFAIDSEKAPVFSQQDNVKLTEATPRTAISAEDKAHLEKSETPRCKCKKSQCLRLHCVCFSENGYCGPSCGCTDCLNSPQFETAREFVIKKTTEINPYAFEKKVKVLESGEKAVNAQGCKCSRNNCQKNYCECYKFGVGCSSVCRCSNCLNNKIELAQNELHEVPVRGFRKKHKIVISQKQVCEEDPAFCLRSITYVPHKKKIAKPLKA